MVYLETITYRIHVVYIPHSLLLQNKVYTEVHVDKYLLCGFSSENCLQRNLLLILLGNESVESLVLKFFNNI